MVLKKTKDLLYELAGHKCELCHKEYEIEQIDIHRIKRGHEGGKYNWRNCMVLCKSCHKITHGGEFK